MTPTLVAKDAHQGGVFRCNVVAPFQQMKLEWKWYKPATYDKLIATSTSPFPRTNCKATCSYFLTRKSI